MAGPQSAFMIGVPKAATTWLCDELGRHPEIELSEPKETNTFGATKSSVDHDLQRLAEIERYRRSFSGPKRIQLDGSIHMFADPFAARIMAQHFPDARLILIVREPLERCYSHYQMLAAGQVGRLARLRPPPFQEAMTSAAAYTDSLYGTHWHRWLRYVKRDQILVIPDVRLRTDLQGVARDLESHLGLTPNSLRLVRDRVTNRGQTARRWYRILRAAALALPGPAYHILQKVFGRGRWKRAKYTTGYAPFDARWYADYRYAFLPEIQEFEEATGLDLSEWRIKYSD